MILAALQPKDDEQRILFLETIWYLLNRIDRIAYDQFAARGMTISSAAMESFHRIAQQRIKIPGATWTADMMAAMLNIRMLNAIGNEEAFWNDSKARNSIAQAFHSRVAS